MQAQLIYNDPIAGASTLTLPVIASRGFIAPDDWGLWPELQQIALDGSIFESFVGFRRRFSIDFGVVSSLPYQKALLYFMLDPDRQLKTTMTAPTITAATLISGSLGIDTHYFKVSALDAVGESAASVEYPKLTTENSGIRLTWTNVTGAQAYRVYHTLDSGNYDTTSLQAQVTSNTYDYLGTVDDTEGQPLSATVAIDVALEDPTGFSNEWVDNTEYGRRYILNLLEKEIRTEFP